MPAALLKSCPCGCGALVEKGRCGLSTQARERSRVIERKQLAGGADLYNSARWRELRVRFRRLLAEAGVLASCGARLPGAAMTNDSTCEFESMGDEYHKLRTGRTLSLDHIVDHHGDRDKFFNVLNLQLLCDRDHTAKTHRDGGRR